MQAAAKRENRMPAVAAALCVASSLLAGCATTSSLRNGERAERNDNYDLAVVEYTKAVRENPDDLTARKSLDRARIRAAQDHFIRGRRLAADDRYEEALVELQIAAELNPAGGDIDAALRETRQRLRTKYASL